MTLAVRPAVAMFERDGTLPLFPRDEWIFVAMQMCGGTL